MQPDASNTAGTTPSLFQLLTGQPAIDNASAAAPAIAYSAGQNAAQGILDTIAPYAGYIVLGIGAIVVALALGGR